MVSTQWSSGTIDAIPAAGLFALACAATLAIWNPNPWLAWGYEAGVFFLAAVSCLRARLGVTALGLALAAISLSGFVQLATNQADYRGTTLNAALQTAALAATALIAGCAFRRARDAALRGFAWFGLFLSVASVLSYFTSPGKILWIIPSPYPDNWGPFLSRNNFAQFLELCFPVALYQAARGGGKWTCVVAPAAMLAAGIASASRAGSILLVAEAIAGLLLLRGSRRWVLPFVLAAAGFTAVAGAGALWNRLAQPDPFAHRREIFHSTEAMIAVHPWRGFGLGTFSTVYPAFAEFDDGASVEHAHNDWLEWAAEGGVPFAMLWAVVAALTLRPAIRSVWGLGVPAVFLHALVDYPFARFGVAAWIFFLIGALAQERSGPRALLTHRRRP